MEAFSNIMSLYSESTLTLRGPSPLNWGFSLLYFNWCSKVYGTASFPRRDKGAIDKG